MACFNHDMMLHVALRLQSRNQGNTDSSAHQHPSAPRVPRNALIDPLTLLQTCATHLTSHLAARRAEDPHLSHLFS